MTFANAAVPIGAHYGVIGTLIAGLYNLRTTQHVPN
jgi:hypothetical protein